MQLKKDLEYLDLKVRKMMMDKVDQLIPVSYFNKSFPLSVFFSLQLRLF